MGITLIRERKKTRKGRSRKEDENQKRREEKKGRKEG